MFKHTQKILASLFILAGITLFISCQDQQPVASNDAGQMNLSKVSTFVMPAGATFVSASLELYTWSWMNPPHNVDVHSVTADWTCPTWDEIATSYDPTAITSFDMDGIGGAHWESVDISATVQAWLSGATNYGLMLKNQDAYAGVDKLGQFLSNDYPDATLRPYLKIVTTAGTIEVEPLADTYISSINPDLTFCTEEKLYIGYVDLGTGLAEKRPLIRFDIEPQVIEDCETAYAKGPTGVSTCFLAIPNKQGTNWGWTNLVSAPGTYNWPIWAAAGQCDTDKGTLVGNLNVVYAGGVVTITYQINPPFTLNLDETHVWVGAGMLPMKSGKYQSNPGGFNYNFQNPVVVTIAAPFYIAAHAEICGPY